MTFSFCNKKENYSCLGKGNILSWERKEWGTFKPADICKTMQLEWMNVLMNAHNRGKGSRLTQWGRQKLDSSRQPSSSYTKTECVRIGRRKNMQELKRSHQGQRTCIISRGSRLLFQKLFSNFYYSLLFQIIGLKKFTTNLLFLNQ